MTVEPVVVGVDGSQESRLALRWAFEYAQMRGAPVDAVIAWEVPPTYGGDCSFDDADLEKTARGTAEEAIRSVLGGSAPVSLRVERGHPAPVLVAASAHAQLLVVGSRGHGAFAGMLLGSVSQHCVHQAHCPVVVIRRPEGEQWPDS
jgi:nucleotide-binding universal stress UspA family protein